MTNEPDDAPVTVRLTRHDAELLANWVERNPQFTGYTPAGFALTNLVSALRDALAAPPPPS